MQTKELIEIVIFSGPTLSKDALANNNELWLKPAAQGDILSCYLMYSPKIIFLIDGFYETVPSVLHKEILYVMQKGVNVIGASSMGALRAAELQPFGMIGIGKIFTDFYNGTLEDDDEVAITHAPKELNYAKTSEAMVNIRATSELAVEKEIISRNDGNIILNNAKKLFYKDRNWQNIIKPEYFFDKTSYILNWFIQNTLDQKFQDATLGLEYARKLNANSHSANRVKYYFEYTSFFRRVMNEQTISKTEY